MPRSRGLTSFLGRHIVGLTAFDRSHERALVDDGVGECHVLTGFVLEIKGLWHLVTAGHIISDLNTALENGQRLEDWRLVDCLGFQAQHFEAIPFDYCGAPRLVVESDEHGFDYGVIALRSYYQRLLRANGVVPMNEQSWNRDWPKSFDEYQLLGFPSQLVRAARTAPGRAAVNFGLVRIPVEKISEPPVELAKKTERFYGRINLRAGGSANIDDIDGMSGGPIIGFKKNHPEVGKDAYWLIGVQSGWHRATMTIAACPIQQFIQFLASESAKGHPDP